MPPGVRASSDSRSEASGALMRLLWAEVEVVVEEGEGQAPDPDVISSVCKRLNTRMCVVFAPDDSEEGKAVPWRTPSPDPGPPPWTLDSGPWFLATSSESLLPGLWTLVPGSWQQTLNPWSLPSGPCSGPWPQGPWPLATDPLPDIMVPLVPAPSPCSLSSVSSSQPH